MSILLIYCVLVGIASGVVYFKWGIKQTTYYITPADVGFHLTLAVCVAGIGAAAAPFLPFILPPALIGYFAWKYLCKIYITNND